MAVTPTFPGTPNIESASITTADTSRTGPTNYGTIFTAGTNGSVVYRVFVKATGNTTAGLVLLFVHDGTNWRVLKEIPTATVTVSGTVPSWEDEVSFSDLILESGWTLRVSTYTGDDFHVVATGAHF